MHEIIHLAVGLSIYLFEGFSYQALITYILFSILYILLICDLKKFYLPLYLNLSITLVAIISGFFGIALIEDYGFLNISNISLSLIGFIFGYFFLWSINLIYKLLKKEDGIGGGDFILLRWDWINCWSIIYSFNSPIRVIININNYDFQS